MISHFEVARESGSRWFQSAFWDIFNMAANSSPKTVLQCTLTTISTWSAAQSQSWLRHLVCLFPNFMPSFNLVPMVFSFFNDSSWILVRSHAKLKTMLQPRSENSLSSRLERRSTMLMQNVGGGGGGGCKQSVLGEM